MSAYEAESTYKAFLMVPSLFNMASALETMVVTPECQLNRQLSMEDK